MLIRDQMGRTLVLEKTPARIVSLVPSQSEFLWDLGLGNKIAGITKFCIHPEEMYRSVNRVGGTKTPDLDKIRALKPDLIIGNKEENDITSIAILEKEFPVWMSDIVTMKDALQMMSMLGEITGASKEAERICSTVSSSVEKSRNLFKQERVAYFIWNEPLLLAGKGTFIHTVLEHCGFKNVARDLERYPEVSVEQLRQLKPEFCFLSSEPFPFKAEHAELIRSVLPAARVVSTDGETWSWYGSRLRGLNTYLDQLKAQIYA